MEERTSRILAFSSRAFFHVSLETISSPVSLRICRISLKRADRALFSVRTASISSSRAFNSSRMGVTASLYSALVSAAKAGKDRRHPITTVVTASFIHFFIVHHILSFQCGTGAFIPWDSASRNIKRFLQGPPRGGREF